MKSRLSRLDPRIQYEIQAFCFAGSYLLLEVHTPSSYLPRYATKLGKQFITNTREDYPCITSNSPKTFNILTALHRLFVRPEAVIRFSIRKEMADDSKTRSAESGVDINGR